MITLAERLLEALQLYCGLGLTADAAAIRVAGADGLHTAESRLIALLLTGYLRGAREWARQTVQEAGR